MKLTNENGFSLSMAVWLADDDYDHAPVKGPYLSVTDLLKPLRMIVLNQRAKALTETAGASESIDISRFVPSRLGTAVHAAVEHTWRSRYHKALASLNYPKKIIDMIRINPTKEEIQKEGADNIIPVYMEQRSYKKMGAYTIGGKYDFVGNGTLEDFKSMGVYGYMKGDKDEEQRLQGSLYRWLNPEIVTSDHMLIQQIFTDWSAMMAKTRKGYPAQRILSKKILLMSVKEADNWVKRRINSIELLNNTPESKLPLCSEKELWQSSTTFKYFKNPKNTKRSTANFDNYAAAHERFIKDKSVGVIKEFPGVVKRCGYCPCFDLCTQKDEYIAGGMLQMP